MATEVKLPRLGQGMESGTIVRWLKDEGERVARGEPLYELDTEKVTQEVEAEADGVLLRIAVREGEVEVGRTIAVIGEEGETVEAAPEATAPEPSGDGGMQVPTAGAEEGSRGPARDAERERGRAAGAQEAAAAEQPPARPEGGRVKASPLARRIARERGIELASVRGTGPEGRVVAEDVERAAAAPAPAAAPSPAGADDEVTVVELTQTRRTIARRLTEAWQAPVFQLTVSADMTAALALREQLVEQAAGTAKPTVGDLLTRLTAAALVRHPAVNAHLTGERIERHQAAHVGLAVAAPAGLVVPVVRGAHRLSIAEIAAVRADLVDRARAGKLRRGDLDGGTFTISNLGMFGVEEFVAVLNPPQVAILAVGAVVDRPAVVGGELRVRPMLALTGTFDHRAVDGADGAEFLRTLKALLEQPGLAL